MLTLIILSTLIAISAGGFLHPPPPPLVPPNPQDCSVLGRDWIKPEGLYAYRTPLCFLFVNKPRTCYTARRYCAAKGGRLVEIYSLAKLLWLLSKFYTTQESRWIGLEFHGPGYFPLWFSGAAALPSPPYYNHWGMDQPDNHQPPEDCVVMQSMKGMWNDIPGGEKKKFICETVVFDKFRCNKGGCPIKHGYPGHRGVKVEPDIPGCCDGVTGGYSINEATDPPQMELTGECSGNFTVFAE